MQVENIIHVVLLLKHRRSFLQVRKLKKPTMAVFSLSGSGSSRPVDPSSASAGVGWGNIQPKQSLTSMEGPQRPAQPSFHSLQTETAPMNYAESTGNAEDIRLTLFIASSSVIILTLITVIAVVSCFILCNGDRVMQSFSKPISETRQN